MDSYYTQEEIDDQLKEWQDCLRPKMPFLYFTWMNGYRRQNSPVYTGERIEHELNKGWDQSSCDCHYVENEEELSKAAEDFFAAEEDAKQ